jgi:hypothetical protein
MQTKEIKMLKAKTRAIEDAAKSNRHEATVALAGKYPRPATDLPPSDSPTTLVSVEVPTPSWESFQDFIARELELARLHLEKASDDHTIELRNDRRKREAREAVVGEVYRSFLRARHILEEAIGESTTYDLLGVSGTTPQQPDDLLGLMRTASRTLRDPERLPEDLRLPGMTLSWTDLASALDGDAARLEVALAERREEQRLADLALLRRDRVQAETNDTYVGFTRVLEGLYIAAGQRDLAARLRLTIRSSSGGGTEVEDDGRQPGPSPPPAPPANDEEPVLPMAAAGGTADGDVLPLVALPPASLTPSDDS